MSARKCGITVCRQENGKKSGFLNRQAGVETVERLLTSRFKGPLLQEKVFFSPDCKERKFAQSAGLPVAIGK